MVFCCGGHVLQISSPDSAAAYNGGEQYVKNPPPSNGDLTPPDARTRVSAIRRSKIRTISGASATPSGASAVSSRASRVHDVPPPSEVWWSTCLQVSAPFFLAGAGTIGAGVILDKVQHTEVFKAIPALLILVPSLIGLKGNLDMCLASRLSTLANVGEMDSLSNLWRMVYGNIALVQVQAIVAAICVSIFAVSVSAITTDDTFEFTHAIILSASSLSTATSSCFVLDIVMIGVIILAYRYKMNPDNLATPLAASIGDVVSLSLLAVFSRCFYSLHDDSVWAAYTLIGCYLLVLPVLVFIVYRNEYTKPVLTSGWVPVLSALMISGCGGLVMNLIVNAYENFVVFQPIINGIGGNLVSVQASRISTMLHQSSVPGKIPPYTKLWASPWAALVHGLPHAETARILFVLSVVGQVLFIHIADLVKTQTITLNYEFVLCYIAASSIQVLLLLYLAHFFIHFMWRLKVDPDNSAIPFLTAIGDLSGSSLLAAAFVFLDLVLHSDSIEHANTTTA